MFVRLLYFSILILLFSPLNGVLIKDDLHSKWDHFEMMDGNGLYLLSWKFLNKEIHFTVTVNTRGTIGLGFSKVKSSIIDFLLIWTDDNSGLPHILDCHKINENSRPVQDDTQNYKIITGFQNVTHTHVEFSREMETCDPYDITLGSDTITVFWSFGKNDPINGNLKNPEKMRGHKLLNIFGPLHKQKLFSNITNITQWDVTAKNISIEHHMDTLYWCKIIQVPLLTKHHIIGYEPLLTKHTQGDRTLVRHMTLYECSVTTYPGSDPTSWDVWVKSSGAVCNSNLLTPRDWDSCITPIATWSIGASGQFLPEHVGFPIGDQHSAKYFMLEIHYDNELKIKFSDRSGFRIYYTNELRKYDGGIMIAGVSISDTLLIPPEQKLYRSVGICGPSCTDNVFPDDGINIISAAINTHTAGKQIVLRHIHNGMQLPNIIEDTNFNYEYQQFRQLDSERKILPGDFIILECAYETLDRKKLTFGGYSTKQEMCLSFITYYPKTELAGCYSMTPVREFFQIFGVNQFYSLSMNDIENLFLYNGNMLDFLSNSTISQSTEEFSNSNTYDNNRYLNEDALYNESILNKLIISDPIEFHDRTFLSHLNQLPWNESLFSKRVEQIVVSGKHMTFCRISNESVSIPSEIILYPKYIIFEKSTKMCPYHFNMHNVSVNIKFNVFLKLILIIIFL